MTGGTPAEVNDRGRPQADPKGSGLYHVFLALGFAGSEVGVLLDVSVVAVAGLWLFGWSLVGTFDEGGIIELDDTARPFVLVGVAYLLFGVSLYGIGATTGVDLTRRAVAFLVASLGLVAYAGTASVRTESARAREV
jgi:hypothetical protein